MNLHFLATFEIFPLNIVFATYAVMSLITFAAYGVDKRRAVRRRWRIKEMHLHLLELFFGWPGAVGGQVFFRHKVRKSRFMAVFALIVVIHLAAWVIWFRNA